MLIQNVAIHQKDYMVQQPRGPLFTTTPLWKPQILHNRFLLNVTLMTTFEILFVKWNSLNYT
jgi:hypothetical protein